MPTPLKSTDRDDSLQSVFEGRDLKREDAIRFVSSSGEAARELWSVAAALRTAGKGNVVSYSRKVFIPLTNLCRDTCGYCTFKKDPWENDALTMTPQQVISVAEAGRKLHCTEALFTLGERPEQRFAEARDALRK